MSEPSLSIVIPCYNYGHYLESALGSILSQDYSSYEIILVDDGSTDHTPQIGKAYARQHPHIRYIQLERNFGLFHASQCGAKEAQGKFLHFFSSDDLYLPGFLSKSLSLLHANPSLSLVCSDIGYFQDGSSHIEPRPLMEGSVTTSLFVPQELPSLCRTKNFRVAGTSCILRKELLTHFGTLDPKLENISDWFFFHKIAFSEGIGYIPETLIAMRLHVQAYTSQVKRDKKRRRAAYRHLLNTLIKEPRLREQFQQAGLLDFVFRELKWKLYLNPNYSCYWWGKV